MSEQVTGGTHEEERCELRVHNYEAQRTSTEGDKGDGGGGGTTKCGRCVRDWERGACTTRRPVRASHVVHVGTLVGVWGQEDRHAPKTLQQLQLFELSSQCPCTRIRDAVVVQPGAPCEERGQATGHAMVNVQQERGEAMRLRT